MDTVHQTEHQVQPWEGGGTRGRREEGTEESEEGREEGGRREGYFIIIKVGGESGLCLGGQCNPDRSASDQTR